MMMWDGDWGWGAWVAMSVTMIIFWGGAAVAIGWSLRNAASTSRPSRSSAAEVLAERYAKGEIDEDEYRQRLAVLGEASQ